MDVAGIVILTNVFLGYRWTNVLFTLWIRQPLCVLGAVHSRRQSGNTVLAQSLQSFMNLWSIVSDERSFIHVTTEYAISHQQNILYITRVLQNIDSLGSNFLTCPGSVEVGGGKYFWD